MSQVDIEYNKLIRHIMDNGNVRTDRTGVGTKGVFGYQMRFNLQEEFPILTTKRVFWKGVAGELLWFLSGSTNKNVLKDKYGVSIWDEWGLENGELGPIYSHNWRNFGGSYNEGLHNGIDQIAQVIEDIKNTPDSRRLIVTAWNPEDLHSIKMYKGLPACHTMFQFYVEDGRLSCQLYQRSADVFLGVPFNIASYALLTHMIAHVTGLKAGNFIHTFGDVHLYLNHFSQANEQLSRDPKEAPVLVLNNSITCIDDFKLEDISLTGYNPHPAIKAPIAV